MASAPAMAATVVSVALASPAASRAALFGAPVTKSVVHAGPHRLSSSSSSRLVVRASSGPSTTTTTVKERAVAGLTAAALAAALVLPDVAEAAQPGLSPSLKNFLLSIVAGGVVLSVIGGAVIAVANFDPVKRT